MTLKTECGTPPFQAHTNEWILMNGIHWYERIDQAFFLTPAVEKTETQGKNSSQKLKEKTQPPGGFSLQLGKFKKKT